MIEPKQAVAIAKEHAGDMLGHVDFSLEEIERDSYKGSEVWSITLGFSRDLSLLPPISRMGADPVQYKRVLIDVNTGDLVAIKLRERATQ